MPIPYVESGILLLPSPASDIPDKKDRDIEEEEILRD